MESDHQEALNRAMQRLGTRLVFGIDDVAAYYGYAHRVPEPRRAKRQAAACRVCDGTGRKKGRKCRSCLPRQRQKAADGRSGRR